MGRLDNGAPLFEIRHSVHSEFIPDCLRSVTRQRQKRRKHINCGYQFLIRVFYFFENFYR